MNEASVDEQLPEVSEEVAKIAGEVVTFALLNEIQIESVDQDALGGAAIYLSNDDKEAWVCLLNSGSYSILDLAECKTIASTLDYDILMEFLFSD